MTLNNNTTYLFSLFIVLLVFNPVAYAQNVETEWDLGIGATAIHLPAYPGSSQNVSYLIPYPYIYVKTKYIEVDDGVRGFVYESSRFRLNLSADFGVPVDNDEASLRDGMPDLNTVLQLGPMLEIVLDGGRDQPFESRLELPARIADSSRRSCQE